MDTMKLALIGCGLLGGSTVAAWRRGAHVGPVVAYDRDPHAAERALELGLADHAAAGLAEALADAGCIVLATPVGALASLFEAIARHAPADALITDVGSVKASVIADARRALGARFERYVPAHPIAGGELPGIDRASADLFAGRWVITTPEADTDAQALARVESLWSACGARVRRMSASEHDRIFAAVSHLPHLLAFALVDLVASQPDGARMLQLAGAGFEDSTRIAASDPVLWRDVALANRSALGAALAQYRVGLEALQAAVDAGDAQALERVFERASRVRRAPGLGGADGEARGR